MPDYCNVVDYQKYAIVVFFDTEFIFMVDL